MGWAAVAMQVAGGVLKANADIQAAQTQKRIAARNAQIAHMKAEDATLRGGQEAGLKRMEGSQIVGAAGAKAAAGNVDVQSGSVVATETGTRAMNEMDVQAIRTNAAREAWAYESQEQDFDLQRRLAKQSEQWAPATALLGTGGSAIQTGYQTGLFKVG